MSTTFFQNQSTKNPTLRCYVFLYINSILYCLIVFWIFDLKMETLLCDSKVISVFLPLDFMWHRRMKNKHIARTRLKFAVWTMNTFMHLTLCRKLLWIYLNDLLLMIWQYCNKDTYTQNFERKSFEFYGIHKAHIQI